MCSAAEMGLLLVALMAAIALLIILLHSAVVDVIDRIRENAEICDRKNYLLTDIRRGYQARESGKYSKTFDLNGNQVGGFKIKYGK